MTGTYLRDALLWCRVGKVELSPTILKMARRHAPYFETR